LTTWILCNRGHLCAWAGCDYHSRPHERVPECESGLCEALAQAGVKGSKRRCKCVPVGEGNEVMSKNE